MTEGKKKVPEVRFPGFVEPWVERKLGEVCDISSGIMGDTSLSDGNYKITRIETISDGEINKNRIGYCNKKPDSCYLLHKGDILYSNINSLKHIGKVAIFGEEDKLYHGINLLRLVVKNNLYVSDFIYQQLNTEKKKNWAKAHANKAVNQVSINQSNLAKQILYLCEYEEQKKIAHFLIQFDNLITLQQRKLDHLQLKKKGLLQKLFPRDGATVPELRFAGFSGDWEQRKLGEIATFINGRAYSQKELLDNGKYRVLRVGNFYTNDSWYFSDMELDEKYYANYGDLLYTWSATFGPHIWTGEKVIFHYHIWKVELSSQLEKNFTVQLLERDKNEIISDKNGSTMVHITKNGMEKKEVIIPKNVEEQKKIGEFFDQLDDLITLNQRKVDHLQTQKKAMLQKMFV